MRIPGPEFGNATPTPQRGYAQGSLTGGIDAIGELARAGAEVAAQISRNRRIVETAKATVEAARAIDDQADYLLKEDSDFSTQEERFAEFYKNLDKDYRQGVFKNNPDAYQDWKLRIDDHFYNQGRKVKSNAYQQDMADQRVTLGSTLNEMATLFARSDDEARASIIEEGLGFIETANANGVLTDAERKVEEAKFQNTISRNTAKQDIVADPVSALTKLREGKYQGLNADQYVQLETAAISKIETDKAKAAHEMEKVSRELVSDTLLALQNGYAVSDAEYDEAWKASRVTGQSEDLAVARAASRYIRLPKSSRQEIRPQVTGVENAELQKALDDADRIVSQQVDNDGYSYGVRQGLIDEIPINVEDPGSISARVEQAAYLERHYGQPVSPLSDAEADAFVEALAALPPSAKTNLALVLGDSAAVWNQLDKKNATTFAMVGAIGDKAVMQRVFKGQTLLDEKLKSVSRADYMPVFDDYVGQVYGGRDRRAVLDAALAYYSAESKTQDFDEGDFEDALLAVTGGIAEINGGKIELPRGVESRVFEDYLEGFTPEMVRAFGGVGGLSNDQAAALISSGVPVSYGAGQYVINSRIGTLRRPDGSLFIIGYDPSLDSRANTRRNRRAY